MTSKPQIPNPFRAQRVDFAEHIQKPRLFPIELISHLPVTLQHLTEPMRLRTHTSHEMRIRARSFGNSPLFRPFLYCKFKNLRISIQHRKISHAANVKTESLGILLLLILEQPKPICKRFNA